MLKDKIKNFITKKEEISDKKKIENIVVFLIILAITIIVINFIWNDEESNSKNNKETTDSNKKLASNYKDTINDESLESENTTDVKNTMVTELEEILSKINGVGEVKVMITYSETSKTVPIYNEESSEENTEETDSEGGTRKVTQTDTKKEVIYEENENGKTLITQSIISPSIEGAIITAKGANDASIKTNIIQAVAAVTGLPTHKIQVFEMSLN